MGSRQSAYPDWTERGNGPKDYPSVTSNFVSVNCKCGSAKWDVIRTAVTWAGRCVCARVCVYICVFLFVCVCGDVSRVLFDVYFWNAEQRAIQLSSRISSVWIANTGRQLWCVQGSCDVDGVMSVRACDFVCMFVFVRDFGYWMMNDEDAYEVMFWSISCEQWTLL